MSSLIVEVCKVDKVSDHPDPETLKLCLAHVKDWTVVIRKHEDGITQFKEGDKVVFFPPDSILPGKLAEKLGVVNYLKRLAANSDGTRPDGGRVTVARLRGQPSYGLAIAPDDPSWAIGQDVAEHYGVTKWEPPLECVDGDAEKPNNAFHKYYDMENIKNFPDVIKDGELVVISEKLHGSNGRCGLVRESDETGAMVFTWMAGSHGVRRREWLTKKRIKEDGTTEEWKERSQFWQPLSLSGMKEMIQSLCDGKNDVVVFGEIYGSGVQDMTYGFDHGKRDFRVFDISVNGAYLDVQTKLDLCAKFNVRTVPILYDGPFRKEVVEKFVSGETTICSPEKAGKFKGREGIVITTKTEQSYSEGRFRMNRKVLKAINFAYLERKNGTEFH